MNVRPAQLRDARGIANVHVRAWQTAYRGIVSEKHLSTLSVDQREESWKECLTLNRPETWVAEVLPELVGWVAFGGSRDDDATPSAGEVEALYVLPEYWSTGIGRALWLKARARLKERGFGSVMLWVLAENTRAIRFYGAAGFAPSWERNITIGGRILSEIRYEAPIG
jgi:ribosomal protein S18 acetylase RimI-like enzyme